MDLIDINCDLGEGIGNDAEIMPFISSCNIACGGHYGDAMSISETISLATENSVKIGAHPSYPDKINFGRKLITISEHELYASLCEQLMFFNSHCHKFGVNLHHVKLHGALYNVAARDEKTAKIVLKSLTDCEINAKIYAPYQSVLAELAQPRFDVLYEAFIDRRYHNNLQLVARNREDAIISDKSEAWAHLLHILKTGTVKTVEGFDQKIKADTFCIHGDQPNAQQLVKYISENLSKYY
ncbi:MAG: 5-oxoprolinase subunit PxpA [Marinicellaceae bacterium]